MIAINRGLAGLAGALVLALGLSACAGSPAPTATPSGPTESTKLTVITHDSFALSEDVVASFKKATGYQVDFVAPGDAGTVVNQLILSKDAPLGDVVFGIDNTFAARAIGEGILSAYTSPALPAGSEDLAVDEGHRLTPIDFGDVCVNADDGWFTARRQPKPATLDDLTKPEYANLLVVENPASSSPGLAFLAATVGAKGEAGYLDYWRALKANGVKVVKGWTEAYTVEFSAGQGKGDRPLVVSYATSPAYVVDAKGKALTSALTQTCFRQVEYAGVIKGAQNEVGARKFIDFLLSDEVQADIPGQMYMYPANRAIPLPEAWQANAPAVTAPISVSPGLLAAQRDTWIKAWTAAVIG